MRNWLVPHGADALRANNFDAIRLAMALLVVWSHSFALWKGSEEGEPISLLLGGSYNAGNIGVLTFFAISGFLITLSWLRARTWRDYLRRRIARIHPGYLVAITLCSLLVVPAFSSRAFGQLSPQEMFGLVSNLWLRGYIIPSDAFGGGAVNGSLWSIPYEFWCYLGVMTLGLLGLLRWRWVYPVLAAAVMLVRLWLDLTGRRPDGGFLAPIIGYAYFWFRVLPPFLLGGAAYLYRDAIPRRVGILIALLAATLVTAHLPLADPVRLAVTRLIFPPALVYGVLYLAFSPAVKAHGAARYGDFSYGTYLYAFPIQQILVATLKGRIPFALFVPLAMALSLLAGVASWHLVERWFLPRVRRKRPLEAESRLVAP